MLKLYENIKILRKENEWSQDELAKKMGYTDRSSIAKIEAGKVDLSQSKIMEFARVFGVEPGDLMGWEDNRIDSYYSSPGYYNSITDDEKYLIETYRDMSNETKDAILKYAEFLSQRDIKEGKV
jgi:transcriptional regulator with XRE-family HTH domain